MCRKVSQTPAQLFMRRPLTFARKRKKRAPGIGEQDVLQPSVTNLTNRQIKRIPVTGWFVTRPRLDESRRHKPP